MYYIGPLSRGVAGKGPKAETKDSLSNYESSTDSNLKIPSPTAFNTLYTLLLMRGGLLYGGSGLLLMA